MGRYLVTGGAGFIGSVLTRRLLKEGHEVVVVDNLSTGKRSNVPTLAAFIEADLSTPESLAQLPDIDFDAIIHLAAQSSGAIGQKNPYADMQANVGSTLQLSRWAIERNISRFIYSSSMTVYGQGNAEPVDEDAPLAPISYYGVSKLASENYLRIAAAEGLRSTCLRFYNVYGAGQNLGNLYQGMASIYLAYLLKGEKVPVTGRFDRYRDFTHVDDVVEAMMLTLELSQTPSLVYNVGTGRKTTVGDLLPLLIRLVGLPANHPIEELAGSSSDIFGSVADPSRIRRDLGWSPTIDLEHGMAEMVEWGKHQ